MKTQTVEAWQINNRINLMLLDVISDEGMECTLSKRGGRNVAAQFAHLHNVRVGWLEAIAKDLFQTQKSIAEDDRLDRAFLKQRLSESGSAIATMLERSVDNGGEVKGFKRGVIPLLGYFMTHDAHHRGSILLTLKQSGHKIDKETQFRIWEWGKI